MIPVSESPRRALYTIARHPAEVGRVRRLVAATLRAWGLGDDGKVVSRALSELVAGSLRHGCGVVHVLIAAQGPRVRIEVHDGDLPMGSFALVEQVADAWGTEAGADPLAFFEIELRPQAPGAHGRPGQRRPADQADQAEPDAPTPPAVAPN